MRIALISDVHLSVNPIPFPHVDADVLVLAGDISRPERAMAWAKGSALPTLYVCGNHEFYGSDLVTVYDELKREAVGTNVTVLERNEWFHNGVRFLGCTLWSDFRLMPTKEARDEGIEQGMKFTRDYTHIRLAPDFPALFTPAVSQMVFLQSVDWLEYSFSKPHDGPTVVVTHFAPSRKSISPKFEGSPVNSCFVSDLEPQILRWQPDLWLHGHTHDSFDYQVGKTRVVCNARGYAKDGVPENPKFNSALVIELERAFEQ